MAENRDSSHPELGEEVPRHGDSNHPNQQEGETNPGRLPPAITKENEHGVGEQYDTGKRGEQNQHDEMVRIAVLYEFRVDQRSGNQDTAEESTQDCKTAEISAHTIRRPCVIRNW